MTQSGFELSASPRTVPLSLTESEVPWSALDEQDFQAVNKYVSVANFSILFYAFREILKTIFRGVLDSQPHCAESTDYYFATTKPSHAFKLIQKLITIEYFIVKIILCSFH